ncbi:MAG: hypothetical protein IPL71_18475 [Anaerolineales bacterium]|uniref:hypothetical protein n=1 Tax=Candidatus Villigracilis proximus TaxID=3140683 RepID=UPI00313646AB|nr:hypothetical protein [Anaerolineales bacterium]
MIPIAASNKAREDAIVDYTRESMLETEEKLTETFKATLGSLSGSLSSELVQAELAAMRDAIQDVMEDISEHLGISSKLKAIEEEFEGVDISSSTPMSVLNDLMSRYPKTSDAKG